MELLLGGLLPLGGELVAARSGSPDGSKLAEVVLSVARTLGPTVRPRALGTELLPAVVTSVQRPLFPTDCRVARLKPTVRTTLIVVVAHWVAPHFVCARWRD